MKQRERSKVNMWWVWCYSLENFGPGKTGNRFRRRHTAVFGMLLMMESASVDNAYVHLNFHNASSSYDYKTIFSL